jgi:membrane-associated phospholipid phosphatase
LLAWGLIAGMLIAFLLAQHRHAFTFDAVRAVPATIGLVALMLAVWIGERTGRPRLAAGATAFLQMTLFTLLGVVLAYAFAADAGPLWDGSLAAADHALGFDWRSILLSLDRSVPLIWLLGFAYHSLTLQMIVIIVALSAASRFETLRAMVAAAILSGFVTILISAFTPAMGNLYDPGDYSHLWPSIAWLERDLIGGLRDGSMRVLDLTMLMGIVSFPSFHATLAAIFIWAWRAIPGMKWPGAVWAIVTIVATPVFGGHYGVDVLMGLALAPPAILLVRGLTPRRPHPSAAAVPVSV